MKFSLIKQKWMSAKPKTKVLIICAISLCIVLPLSAYIITTINTAKEKGLIVVKTENRDRDSDGSPDWLEKLLGSDEVDADIYPNKAIEGNTNKNIGTIIGINIKNSGGALTENGELKLADNLSQIILDRIKKEYPNIKFNIKSTSIANKEIFKQELALALAPISTLPESFAVTILKALGSDGGNSSYLKDLVQICSHAIENLPHETPSDLVELYGNFVERFLGICVPIVSYSKGQSSATALKILEEFFADTRNVDGRIDPDSASWMSFYLSELHKKLENI